MTQELEPIFTKAEGTFATGFKGQLLKSAHLLIYHEPTEKLPEKNTLWKIYNFHDSGSYVEDVRVSILDPATSRRILNN